MDIVKLLRSFSLLCLLGPLVIQSLPVADRMPEPTVALKLSYNQVLQNLNNLFHLVLNYEEKVKKQNVTTEDIQKSIKQTHDSVMKMERITAFHSELYHLHLLSVTREITIKENRLRNYTAEQDSLTMERAEWEGKTENFRLEIMDFETQVSNSDELIKLAEDKPIKKRKLKLKRTTTLPEGSATSGLVVNEKSLHIIKTERISLLASLNEHRRLLKISENNLTDLSDRLLDIEKSIKNIQTSILSARSKQEQLRTVYLVLRDLGIQFRNIGNSLAKFYDKLWLVEDQQEVIELLQPLSELIQMLSRKPRQTGRQTQVMT